MFKLINLELLFIKHKSKQNYVESNQTNFLSDLTRS
jgi:hypothetical protein